MLKNKYIILNILYMKNIILLIIASEDNKCYNEMKYIINSYCKLYKDSHNLKYFFIQLNESIPDSILVKENNIYVRGKESLIPGILKKTIESLNYINNNYDYDIVIRTNLSSFYNLDNLYRLIDTKIFDNNNIAIGYRPFNTFISGTSIILSKINALKLCDYTLYKDVYNNNRNDDVIISEILKRIGIPLISLPTNYHELIMNDINQQVPDDISNILFFRVKSLNRMYDVDVFKQLYKRIYNLKNNLEKSTYNNKEYPIVKMFFLICIYFQYKKIYIFMFANYCKYNRYVTRFEW